MDMQVPSTVLPSPLPFPSHVLTPIPKPRMMATAYMGQLSHEGGTSHAAEVAGSHCQLCEALLSRKQQLSQQRRNQTPTKGPIKTIHLFLANCTSFFHRLYPRSVVGRKFSPALKIPKLRDETQRKAGRESLAGKTQGRLGDPDSMQPPALPSTSCEDAGCTTPHCSLQHVPFSYMIQREPESLPVLQTHSLVDNQNNSGPQHPCLVDNEIAPEPGHLTQNCTQQNTSLHTQGHGAVLSSQI